jgi:cell division septation protein DedD
VAGPGTRNNNSQGWEGSELKLPGQTRIVPRHVYEQRDTQVAVVPAGYRPAWDDGRLNQYRAYQTVDGYYATQKEWTNTVPRGLVVQAKKHEVKSPVIAYSTRSAYRAPASQVTAAPVISTRSAPKAVAGPARFVEIGVFTTQPKARAAAARLTGAGLPVKISSYKRNGQVLRRVMVGPYGTTGALNAGLQSVRSVGYTQAYTR